jgi:hypothetical protein
VGIGIQKTNAVIGISHRSPVPEQKNAGLHRFIPVPDWFRHR